MTRRHAQKPYWKMNPQELAGATTEFDQEFVADTFSPLTSEMKAAWERARRKLDRERNGRDERVVSVSLEKKLLARSDALAKKLGITRAALITHCLKAVLAAEAQL